MQAQAQGKHRSGRSRIARSAWLVSLVALGGVGLARPAWGAVEEPDGRIVPQWGSEGAWVTTDVGQDVIDCCQVEADGSSTSLQSLFDSRGEQIDWLEDAAIEPSYFSPLCGFRGTLVLRGGGCKVDFGWYNVDLNSETPPADADIHPLVSVADVEAMFASGVYDADIAVNPGLEFRPRVGDPPIPGVPITDIRADPRYAGGLIGLATKAGAVCTQTHYSEARLNDWCTNTGLCPEPAPWVMAVMYRSTATPDAFYLAFEDLPTSASAFDPPTPPDEWGYSYNNDGDFNDFVYFVEGVTCEGGGQPCLTSAEGACGYGLTECQPDGSTQCVPQLQESPEICDNIDNDCNGLVDDGDLCDPGYVCDKGVCNPNCAGGEFPCPSPLMCQDETGLCMDQACLDVTCEAGQVCLGGVCVGGCNNVVCPWGQVCQLGRCVDPCVGREPGGPNACPGDMVCEGGVCIESCHCRVCAPGMVCDLASGACVSNGCSGVACADNEVCVTGDGGAGTCVNACGNVICPGGAECNPGTGDCDPPLPGISPNTEPWEIVMLPDGGLLRRYPDGTEEAVQRTEDGGLEVVAVAPGGGADEGGAPAPASESGCSCRAVGGPASPWAGAGLLLLGLGLAGLGRRRGSGVRR